MCACGGSCRLCRPAVIETPTPKQEWRPGDVATVESRLDGVKRPGTYLGAGSDDDIAPFGRWRLEDGGEVWSSIKAIHRLPVVVDPGEPEQIERLWIALRDGRALQSRANLIDALHAYLSPPKPDEPTKWGVVEARCVHSENRQTWVRNENGNWYPLGGGPADDWDSLKEPVVIREGVTP